MNFKRKVTACIILYCIAISVVWMMWVEKQFDRKYKLLWVERFAREYKLKHVNYFVNTEGCVIPRYNAFNKTVMKFFSTPKHLNCHVKAPWTTQINMTLNLKRKGNDVSYCEYQEIVRTPKDDSKFTYSQNTNFTHSVNISSEFIRVICYDKQYKKQYTNFHAFVPRSPTRVVSLDEKLTKHKELNKPKEILNVLFIGLDGLSRLNHIRNMPKTRNFLLQNLSAIDFEGYTKVADNTYFNIVPLTTGNFVEEENKRIEIPNTKGPYDNYNIIWKTYSNNGYSTLFAEDLPSGATFNWKKMGFADKPVDHYVRPFSLAAEEGTEAWYNGRDCMWNRSESKVYLDYCLDFLRTYKDRPHFGYSFLTRVTHDYIKNAAYADDDYYDFLLTLQNQGLVNNTVLFFFSDHGIRYGDILKTDVGQIELRMPTMYIVLPPWFKERYPDMYLNIQKNKNSLTSPFDIHKTLQDILYFTGEPRKNVDVNQRGISLFDPIPETRTCGDAGIVPQWCVCTEQEITLEKNGVIYTGGVDFLLNNINNKTKTYPGCIERTLKTVAYAKLFVNKNTRLTSSAVNATNNIVIFRTLIILTPDDAEFEATLTYDEGTNSFQPAGDISRNTKYGHTADCVEDAVLRKFCYCKLNASTSSTTTPVALLKKA